MPARQQTAAPDGTATDAPARQVLRLNLDSTLRTRSASGQDGAATFGAADSVRASQDGGQTATIFEGNAELRRSGSTLRADRIRYNDATKEAHATGDVEVVRGELRMRGPSLKLQVDSGAGEFDSPRYLIGGRGRGQASKLVMLDDDHFQMRDATYTTCRPDSEDWRLEAKELNVDRTEDYGTGSNARLRFMDHTIFAFPYFAFPLGDERKTGLLPPSISTSSRVGFEISTPFYWNMAPNYDLLITPHLSTRRGLLLDNEFRYLTRPMAGTVRYDVAPQDRATGNTRYSFQALNSIRNIGGWSGGWNINSVSDDNYFVDYSRTLMDSAQRSLPQDAFLTRNFGQWNVLGRVTKFHNILEARLAPPYERLPQLQVSTFRADVGGFDLGLLNDVTWFSRPLAGFPEGMRAVVKPSVSYPMRGASWFFTPRLIGNASAYRLDSNPVTPTSPGGSTSLTRFVPTFSADAGFVMERPIELQGRSMVQTLEPRLFYVYTPYRDQSQFPVFDSTPMDFNFAQLFTENPYTGHDRIADANHLTPALISRFYDSEYGTERLRLAVAQRFYFDTQRVTLPGYESRTDRNSDLLLAASGLFRRGLSFDVGMQYSLRNSRVPRYSAAAHYWPGNGRILNAGVHYQANEYAQYDMSFQWPVSARWSALGKINYSFLKEKMNPITGTSYPVKPGLVEGVLGVEYTEDCWATRFVVQRYVTAEGRYTNAFFAQLDLRGLGRAGPDPFSILVRTIQGYRVPTGPVPSASPAPGYYGY